MIKVLNGGLFSTIQDLGRVGFKKFGMPPAGAMDKFAYRVSQLLVGNLEYYGSIETTIIGVTLEFHTDMMFAVTGAENELFINNTKINLWQSYFAKKGDILRLGIAKNGVRNYISFSKRLNIRRINDSLSTYSKSKIGGFHGRALQAGDKIEIFENEKEFKELKLPSEFIPKYKKEATIHVILGPEDNAFTDNGIHTFLNSKYTISKDSDRMGYRLNGNTIEHLVGADILSNPTFFGSIQVPNDGKPIILMADAQTAGGYTKIATVINSDLDTLAQMPPNSKINFKQISLNEAVQIYIKKKKRFREIKETLKDQVSFYNITIGNKTFNVKVERKYIT